MTPTPIRALAFGPRWPSQGCAVAVEVRRDALVLETPDGRETEVPYGWITPRAGGWDGNSLTLEWQDGGGAHAVAFQGDALQALRAAAPELLRARFASAPRGAPRLRVGSNRSLWIAGAALLAVVTLAVVLFVTQSHRLVNAAAARVPANWEEQLGRATFETMKATHKAWPEGEATRLLDDLGNRLAAQSQSPYTFRWLLLEDKQVNAMAAPGGYVIVFTGLMDRAASPEELAGVLAHEVQHVILQHSVRGLIRSFGWKLTLSLLLGGAGDLGAPIATWVEHLGGLQFSRQQETEADLAGVELLRRAGIDPTGMASFFETLAADGRELPALLSTHPASEARARIVRDAIATLPPAPPLPYDWTAVQAELERSAKP